MTKILNKIIVVLAFIVVGFACDKVDDLKVYADGVKSITLESSVATIAPTVAQANSPVLTFNWSDPKYATDSSTVKYILAIDSTGKNFVKENTRILLGARTSSFTGRELNAILLNLGYRLGVSQAIDVRVISSYNNNNERYFSNIVKVMVTPFADPSALTTANTSVTCALATASAASNSFNWSNSFTGYTGVISYSLEFDSATKNFALPKTIAVGPSILTKGLTQGEMNQTALDCNVVGGTVGKVEYRVKAVTPSGAFAYSNVVSVTINSYIPILRMYMPGNYQTATGNGTNWTPANAPELIRDQRAGANNNLYYTYIYLPAGAAFKITEGRDWAIAYGAAGPGATSTSGGDFTVAAAGFYRISIDRTALKFDIREGRMGFVGGSTLTGWTPPNIFPNNKMANAGTNLFIGVNTFTVGGGGWKLLDNNDWNNGDLTPNNARSYGAPGGAPANGPLEINGGNFGDFATAGRYRVIWDGRDVNAIKYTTFPASQMRVVGNGMTGVPDWNPGASPQMTYVANGVWTLTLALDANEEIKFLSGNDWPNAANGFLDYEDNSGQSQAIGVAKKIQWEGGNNFKTPTVAGTYTITLDENNQTVTIN
jgi:starch-binding outer membrane protein SusE/F